MGQRGSAPVPVVVTPPSPLAPAALKALIEQHLRLIARPATPRVKGAVAATDGYEIVIDWDELLGAYGATTTPPPAPEPVAEHKETEYHHRLYVGLPVKNIEVRQPVVTERPRPAPTVATPDPAPSARFVARVDLGPGSSLGHGFDPAFLNQLVWTQNPTARPYFSGLMAFGSEHSFLFHLAGTGPGSEGMTRAGEDDPPRIGELLVTGGYAYQKRVNEIVEVAPRVGVGARVMGFEGDLGPGSSSFEDLSVVFTVDFGLTARFMVWEHFGFHLDVGAVVGSRWQITDSEDRSFELLGMNQGRIGGGLSLRF